MYDELIKRLRSATTLPVMNALCQEAADAIEELTDRNVGKWIPVTERLPENVRKSYLCLTDTGYHCEVRWTNNVYGLLWASGNKWGWSIFDVPQYCKVTHWMPLPEPPKEEEK